MNMVSIGSRQEHGEGSHCGLSAFKAWGPINSPPSCSLEGSLANGIQREGEKRKKKRSTNFLNRKSAVLQITNLGAQLEVSEMFRRVCSRTVSWKDPGHASEVRVGAAAISP